MSVGAPRALLYLPDQDLLINPANIATASSTGGGAQTELALPGLTPDTVTINLPFNDFIRELKSKVGRWPNDMFVIDIVENP